MTEALPSSVTFETELGRCAVRWSDAGITGVLLPKTGGTPGPAFEEGAAVPRFVAEAITGIQAVMAGEARDLRGVPLDERGVHPWRRQVYASTRAIPAGTTRSYGEVARAIGRVDHEAARDVGAALARNPFPIIVPCHRVVAANGALTGFSAPGGLATKRRMLELEGAPATASRSSSADHHDPGLPFGRTVYGGPHSVKEVPHAFLPGRREPDARQPRAGGGHPGARHG